MNVIKKINWVIIWGALISLTFSCQNKHQKADAYGNFEIDKTYVSAQAQGQIMNLDIEEGMSLKANQKIGLIDTMMLFYQKQQLWSQLQLAAASLPQIQAQLAVQQQQEENILVQKNRLEKLFKKKAATQKQLDDVQASLDLITAQKNATKVKRQQIAAQLELINSQVATLNYQISKAIIISPISGKVLNQFSRKGEMAAPSKPLFSMANMQDIRLKVFVSGDQLPHIKLQQKVQVYIDKNKKENQSMEGVIVWISEKSEFTPKTVQTKEERVNLVYAVKIKVSHSGELKAGMPAEVMF
ncbi:MAG: HlyD family secretion protein [Bacteroidetes bacterium 4572_77]|nr:MAG: HlyD family secretion protein [Bacteroidetes bacterium 4572_77]